MAKFAEYEKIPAAILIKYGLDAICAPGQVFEVRIPRQMGATISGYFNDTTIAAALIAKENAKIVNGVNTPRDPKSKGIYVTLNPVLPALISRSYNEFEQRAQTTTTDGEILSRRWFPIDLDPRRPSEVSSTAEEKELARVKAQEIKEWLSSLGWPAPIEADSGNGYHLLYRIDMPNDEDSRLSCEYATKIIAGIFTDDDTIVDTTVWNASRIFKVYGTVAGKGSNSAERPHRVSSVLEIPEDLQVTPTEKLEIMAKAMRDSNDEEFKNAAGEYIPDMEQWLLDRGYRTTGPARPFGDGGKKWTIPECPFNKQHKNPMVALSSRNRPVFKCLHNSCSGYTWIDFRKLIDPEYSNPEIIKKRIVDWCLGSEPTPSVEFIEAIFELKQQRNKVLNSIRKQLPKPRWHILSEAINEEARQRRIHSIGEFNEKGNVVGLIQRTRVMQETGEVPSYWMSTFDHRIRVGNVGDIEAVRYEEVHDIKLMLQYHQRNEIWVKANHAAQVIKELASENQINPMRVHLKSLEWDRVERLSSWLTRYMGTIDNEYTRAIGRKWLISAAARGMDPGCQADHMLILEGEQGIGKSQCLRTLGGDYYIEYSRAVSGATNAHKDMVASIIGKLIVEMSELATLRRGDMETLKAILTTTSDEARLAYERDSKTYPRTCVFAGTTNELEGNYIADYTGARRFWPVRVGVVSKPDIASLRVVRDQLWAEAVHAYESGEDWYVVPADIVKAEQAERQTMPDEVDPWYKVIERGLREPDSYRNGVFEAYPRFVDGQQTDDIVIFAGPFHVILGILMTIGIDRQSAYDAARARQILRQLGFKKIRSRRSVSGSTNQYQLRREDTHPHLWESMVKAVEESGAKHEE